MHSFICSKPSSKMIMPIYFFSGDYEYFRENAWQALNILEYYLKNIKYT